MVRLAAVRASAKHKAELGATHGRVLTPVRRSVRTPQQAAAAVHVAPTAALLGSVGYAFAPNEQLGPQLAAGGVLLTDKTKAAALPTDTLATAAASPPPTSAAASPPLPSMAPPPPPPPAAPPAAPPPASAAAQGLPAAPTRGTRKRPHAAAAAVEGPPRRSTRLRGMP